MSESPRYVDRSGQPQDEPQSGVTNFMSWSRLAEILDEEECARGKEQVAGLAITERGLTIYFEKLPAAPKS
jgi:hypothetical protein